MSRDFIGSLQGRSFRQSPNRDRIARGFNLVGGTYQAFVQWQIDYDSSADAITSSFNAVLLLLMGDVLPTSPGVAYYEYAAGALVSIPSFEAPLDLPLSSANVGEFGSFAEGMRFNLGGGNQYTRLRSMRTKVIFDSPNAAIGTIRPICVFEMMANRENNFSPEANYTHLLTNPTCSPIEGLMQPPPLAIPGRILDYKIDMLPPIATSALGSLILEPLTPVQRPCRQLRREFAYRDDLGAIVKGVNFISFAPPDCCNLAT